MFSSSELFRKTKEQLEAIYEEQEATALCFLIFEELFSLSRSKILAGTEINSTEKIPQLNNCVERLLQGEPLQYIIGHTEFYGNRFEVNPSVLIPRPETEELVQLIISENKNINPLSIIDIGTGSGCIAISLKKNLPHADVSAIDISEQALITAKKNAQLNKVEITFLQKSILSSDTILSPTSVIVSNPPYVMQEEKKLMQKNVLNHEPHLALFVEDHDPLLFYRTIAEKAKISLLPKGKIYFEINEQFGKETAQLLRDAGFREINILKDLSGKDRMVRGEKG